MGRAPRSRLRSPPGRRRQEREPGRSARGARREPGPPRVSARDPRVGAGPGDAQRVTVTVPPVAVAVQEPLPTVGR